MGNQIGKRDEVDKEELEVMFECEQGHVAQSTNTRSTHQYLVRELAFASTEKMSKCRSSLEPFLQQDSTHASLTSLLHVESATLHTMCGSEQRLRLIFEYSTVSINDEVEARKQDARYFDYEDACHIVIGCVRALQQIENQMRQASTLVTEAVYNRVFINTERILVLESGLIKVAHPLLVSPYDRHQHRHNCYYSPEKLADFDYEEDEKCAVYELGLTLIHILSLQSCRQFYNGFEVKQEEVDKRIFGIWELYHDMLLCEVLTKMTRNFRRDRLDVSECSGLVAILDDRLLKYQPTAQDRTFRTNEGAQFLKTSNSLILEQRDLETSIVRSRLGKQMSSRRCEQKYYESESQRKIRSISRRVESQIVEQDNQVSDMLHEETENKVDNQFKLGSSLKYSMFSSQKLQYFKEPMQEHAKPLKFPQEPSKAGQQKESYVITPESPFYNIALISQSSGQKSATDSAHLKPVDAHGMDDRSAKMRAKQSYFYGNQLAEGIITSNHLLDSIASELRVANKENVPATANSRKQIGGAYNTFEWKRTQFNKRKSEHNNANSVQRHEGSDQRVQQREAMMQ